MEKGFHRQFGLYAFIETGRGEKIGWAGKLNRGDGRGWHKANNQKVVGAKEVFQPSRHISHGAKSGLRTRGQKRVGPKSRGLKKT